MFELALCLTRGEQDAYRMRRSLKKHELWNAKNLPAGFMLHDTAARRMAAPTDTRSAIGPRHQDQAAVGRQLGLCQQHVLEDATTHSKSYLADRGDFITVLNVPTALLDVPIESDSALESRLFEGCAEKLPPPGTPVTLILKPKLDRQSKYCDEETIGFIGLGGMGLAMATNLLKAGYRLRVYNRTAEKARRCEIFSWRPILPPQRS